VIRRGQEDFRAIVLCSRNHLTTATGGATDAGLRVIAVIRRSAGSARSWCPEQVIWRGQEDFGVIVLCS
jgi:hypothetical protein